MSALRCRAVFPWLPQSCKNNRYPTPSRVKTVVLEYSQRRISRLPRRQVRGLNHQGFTRPTPRLQAVDSQIRCSVVAEAAVTCPQHPSQLLQTAQLRSTTTARSLAIPPIRQLRRRRARLHDNTPDSAVTKD